MNFMFVTPAPLVSDCQIIVFDIVGGPILLTHLVETDIDMLSHSNKQVQCTTEVQIQCDSIFQEINLQMT